VSIESHVEREQQPASREVWEQPVLRRLVANDAQGGTGPLDDGNCSGGNATQHSFCYGSSRSGKLSAFAQFASSDVCERHCV